MTLDPLDDDPLDDPLDSDPLDSEALLQARSERCRRRLQEQIFRVLVADLVPERPARREPRAVKRRPKPYPRLMSHRRRFREISHQNRYYLNSPFGPRYRKSSRA